MKLREAPFCFKRRDFLLEEETEKRHILSLYTLVRDLKDVDKIFPAEYRPKLKRSQTDT